MVQIYFVMVIVSPDNSPRVFRKLSKLPFPCPIETILVVPGCKMAIVSSYYYENMNTTEEFYVFLSPAPSSSELLNKGFNNFFSYKNDQLENASQVLMCSGWEEIDEGIAYCFPNYILNRT